MQVQDRIKAFKRVPARDLIPNPKNWRKHPEAQQNAMRSVLADIGFADAVLARETPQGLMLIDGHLRAEIAPDCQMPVLVLDVTELEADKILATHDPLAAMADVDAAALSSLLEGFEIDCEELAKQLDDLVSSIDVDLPEVVEDEAPIDAAAELQSKWQTAEGQLWAIEGKAKHRLVCGDSTKQDVVAKCLHGSLPYLMVTDPPYGAEYDPAWRNEAGDVLGKSKRRCHLTRSLPLAARAMLVRSQARADSQRVHGTTDTQSHRRRLRPVPWQRHDDGCGRAARAALLWNRTRTEIRGSLPRTDGTFRLYVHAS